MAHVQPLFTVLLTGGIMMIPLAILALTAIVIFIDKAFLFWSNTRLPAPIHDLVESYEFEWNDLERHVETLGLQHLFGRFFRVILENRTKPSWWVESRASDETGLIEKSMGRGLWILETIVTAAPLMGLLGTIIGMFGAFSLFGRKGLVNPQGVTGGVAQALIATAFGLFIALFSLFAFNFLSRFQADTLDDMERLGTRLIDHIRMDQGETSR
jgi:biopolymer transport protein ExbB